MTSPQVVYEVARQYHDEDLSQRQIAAHLGISRSKVSRLLTRARQTGVVRIEVVAPRTDDDLRAALCRRLGLTTVFLTPSFASATPPWGGLAEAVGQALTACDLGSGNVLLTSWSRTLWEVARRPLVPVPGVRIAPAMGGLTEVDDCFASNAVTRRFATALGATPLQLHAPAQPSKKLRGELERDPQIRTVLDRWDDADAILTGIRGRAARCGGLRADPPPPRTCRTGPGGGRRGVALLRPAGSPRVLRGRIQPAGDHPGPGSFRRPPHRRCRWRREGTVDHRGRPRWTHQRARHRRGNSRGGPRSPRPERS